MLAGENLLDAAVVIEVYVPVLVLLDEGVDVAAVVVYFPQFAEELRKFFSCHMFPIPGRAGSQTGARPFVTIDVYAGKFFREM